MKTAMATASLGDDVARECTSTQEFEAFMAELLGKEAAILVSSGTQGNLLAIAAQCQRGSELIVGSESHVHLWEAGGTSALFGVSQRTVQLDAAGRMPLAELNAALSLSDPLDDHCSPTSLVALENTCAARAGAALDPGYVASVAELCRRRGLRLHVDGARLPNAAAAWATSHSERDLATALRAQVRGVDSLSLCLSKGLGCPGGAVILGDARTVEKCRRLRKLVGGSTRQAAGLLAAAGLHAMKERDVLADLQRDHLRMQALVAKLQELPGVDVRYGGTNISIVTLPVAAAARVATESTGVRLGPPDAGGSWRLVTHRDIGDGDIAKVVDVFWRAVRT